MARAGRQVAGKEILNTCKTIQEVKAEKKKRLITFLT